MRQIRGPNGVAMTGYRGPSDAPKTGQEAGRCSYMTNYIYVLHMRSIFKIDGISKINTLESYVMRILLKIIVCHVPN